MTALCPKSMASPFTQYNSTLNDLSLTSTSICAKNWDTDDLTRIQVFWQTSDLSKSLKIKAFLWFIIYVIKMPITSSTLPCEMDPAFCFQACWSKMKTSGENLSMFTTKCKDARKPKKKDRKVLHSWAKCKHLKIKPELSSGQMFDKRNPNAYDDIK